ncbi:hypothetical protein BC830DRAFT_1167385 [Chytriomyces sp. MP71]|nr:hypothetical protein BC830DRAFT_1167385 [Chytriomyces sp. MP71]
MSLSRSSSVLSNHSTTSLNHGSKRFSAPVSAFRNAQLAEGGKGAWLAVPGASAHSFGEVPVHVGCDASGRVAVRTGSSGAGEVSVVGANSSPIVTVSPSPIAAFDLSSNGSLLATGSADGIRTFSTSANTTSYLDGVSKRITEHTVSSQTPVTSALKWHPTAAGIIVSAAEHQLSYTDVQAGVTPIVISGDVGVAGFDFNTDGSLVAVPGRDSVVRVYDPRSGSCGVPVAVGAVHHVAGSKPSRAMWLSGGSLDFMFLTTGFSKSRDRECALWDLRNIESGPVVNQRIDSNNGSLISMYDADSNLLFLTGKGDTMIRSYEVSPVAGLTPLPTSFVASKPISGAALVSKLCLDVMECEIARIMTVCGDHVVPISASVLRKNRMEFQPDLFPDTLDKMPVFSSTAWLAGQNPRLTKVNLDPRANRATSVKSPPPRAAPVGKLPPPIPMKAMSLSGRPMSPLGIASPVSAVESPTTPKAASAGSLAYSPIEVSAPPLPTSAGLSVEISETIARLLKEHQAALAPVVLVHSALGQKMDLLLDGLQALQTRVQGLESRSAQPAEGTDATREALQALAGRLEGFTGAVASREETSDALQSVSAKLDASQASLTNLSARVEALAPSFSTRIQEAMSPLNYAHTTLTSEVRAVQTRLETVETSLHALPAVCASAVEGAIAGLSASILARVEDVVREQVESLLDKKRNSYRVPVVPNMGIASTMQKLTGRLALVRSASTELLEGEDGLEDERPFTPEAVDEREE